ncbi:MAG TPA: heterodisulfide reductase-related iron-sulfur binding cluster [Rhodoferax sp.]
MDGQQVKVWESHCIEESPPACTAACPVHVDVRSMVDLIRKGDFKTALAQYARIVPFPGIVGSICDHPCEGVCKRNEAGEALRIHELERACVNAGFNPPPFRVNRQLAPKRIAVVGAGLSGLSLAAELSIKGHAVVVFEQKSAVLDRLRRYDASVLPSAAIDADLARFDGTGLELRLNEQIDLSCADGLTALANNFDAVYLGLGPEAAPGLRNMLALKVDARLVIDPLTFATRHPKIFAGGSQRYGSHYSPVTSLQDGRYAAQSIDRLLQGASLTANRDTQGAQATRLYVNTARHSPLPALVPADPVHGFSQEEAMTEAARCFPCHCLECVKACSYLEHYGAYPKRYIREIFNNETIVMGARKSNRMIDSCTLCGLCAEVCPEELAMGDVCLSARQGMTAKGKMPVSHHDFALRDMAFSRSDAFTLARHQPGFESSAVLFYPGCQLAASSPDQVARLYAHLCSTIDNGVGLMLGCCGAPAQWAAREDLFAEMQNTFASEWRRLGQPLVVTACSSCYRMFADHQPQVPMESLWSVLARSDLPAERSHTAFKNGAPLAIHDPCTTRHEAAIQNGVRRLLERCATEVIELDGPELTTCCGFGGLASFANPEVANKIVDKRIAQSSFDYLTYCAMCRDNFARRGKRAIHVLDLLFPGSDDPAARADPGFSMRQENRGRLKRQLLRDVWRQTVNEPTADIELLISAEVHADLEKKLILLDDVRQTIRHAETSHQKILDPKTGHFIASFRPVSMTYWVEYTVADERYTVHRAYSHRMQLE